MGAVAERHTHVNAHIRDGHAVAAHPRRLSGSSSDGKDSGRPDRGAHRLGLEQEVQAGSRPPPGTPGTITKVATKVWEMDDGSTESHHRYEVVDVNGRHADSRWVRSRKLDFTGMNLSAELQDNLSLWEVRNSRKFMGATFDGANLSDLHGGAADMRKCSFRSAIMRRFNGSYADFRGSDFSGVDLQGANFISADLRGCNWVGAHTAGIHLSSMRRDSNPTDEFSARYERYTLRDAMEASGEEEDDFLIRVWAGEVEVRDNVTCEVRDDYDPETCHVPVWVIQNLRHDRDKDNVE